MVARADILAGRAVIFIDIQDTIEKQLRGIRSKLRMFTAGVSEVGGDLFRGGVAGSFAAYFPVKEFVSFQDQMLFLQTKLQATDEAMKGMEKTVRDLGMTTSFSSTEVAQAATMYAQAGFSMVEVTNSLQAALDLARGGQIDLTTSTSILANALRTFGADASEAESYASKFIVAARLGTLDLVDLGESLKYSSGTFKTLGTNIDEVLGLITNLSKAGLKASLAGTSLQTAFANLSDVAAVEERLGVQLSQEDFKTPVKGLQKIEQALNNMPFLERIKAVQDLANIRGSRAIFGQILVGTEELRKVTEQIKNAGNESRTAAMKLDSRLGGVGRRAVSAFQELQLAIGQTSEGPLTTIGERAAAVFNDMSRLAQGNERVVQTILFMGPAALAAGVGLLTLTSLMGKLAMFITPVMMLNAAIFRLGSALVGAPLTVLGDIMSKTRIGAAGIGASLLKTDPKFAANLAKFKETQKELSAEKVGVLATRDIKVTSTQQRNAQRLINLEQKQAQQRALFAAKSNATILGQQKKTAQELLKIDTNQFLIRAKLQGAFLNATTQLADKEAQLTTRLESLSRKRVRVEAEATNSLKRLMREQAEARLKLFEANNATITGVRSKSLNAQGQREGSLRQRVMDQFTAKDTDLLTKQTQASQELQKITSRRLRIEAAESKFVADAIEEQVKARKALATAQAEQIRMAEEALGSRPAMSGLSTSKELKRQEEYVKGLAKIEDLKRNLAEEALKLEAKQAKELVNLQARRTAELAKLNAREAKASAALAKLNERRNKLSDAANANLSKLEARFQKERETIQARTNKLNSSLAKRELALEIRQAKELTALRASQTKGLASVAKEEAQILSQVKGVSEKRAALKSTTEKKLQKLDQSFAKQRAMLPATVDTSSIKAAEAALYQKQANQRNSIIKKAALEEAAIMTDAREKVAKINKKLKADAPVEKASFLTKQRDFWGGVKGVPEQLKKASTASKGLKTSFWELGKVPNIVKGIKAAFVGIKNVVAGTNWLRVFINGFKTVWTVAKGIFSVLNGIRRFAFSLSGFLTIVEVLILFGDKIPVVKDALKGLSTAFSNMFGNITDMFRDIGLQFGTIGQGIGMMFGGNAELGVAKIKEGIIGIGQAIRDNLIHTWQQFLFDTSTGVEMLRNGITGTISVFKAAGAAIGAIFGTAMQKGEILIKSDGSLTEMVKSIFSPENMKVAFSAIIGFIGSIGESLVSVIGFIGDVLISIKNTFAAILKGLAELPFFGEAAAEAQAEINAPTGKNAERIKYLQEEIKKREDILASPMGRLMASAKQEKAMRDIIAEAKAELKTLGVSTTGTPTNSTEDIRAKLKAQIDKIVAEMTATMDTKVGATPPEKSAQDKLREEAARKAAEAAEEFGGVPSLDRRRGRIPEFDPLEDAFDPPVEGITSSLNDVKDALDTERAKLMQDLLLVPIDPFAVPPELAPELTKFDQMRSSIGKAIGGDFESTRGNLLQMMPKMEELQKEANDHLKNMEVDIEAIANNKTPFVFNA